MTSVRPNVANDDPAVTAVDLLVLGAGWTSTFLFPLLDSRGLTYAYTRRSSPPDGDSRAIQFEFDPTSDDPQPYARLPAARTVLITFPIKDSGACTRLVGAYERVHDGARDWIQLGTTGIWDGGRGAASVQPGSSQPSAQAHGRTDLRASAEPSSDKTSPPDSAQARSAVSWTTRHTPFNTTNPRAVAEEEFLALNGHRHGPSSSPDLGGGEGRQQREAREQQGDVRVTRTTVFNLSGLWGGGRQPRRWVERVAPSKEALKAKGSLHLIHGEDIARAVLAVRDVFDKAAGQRWILSDTRVYDWWDLASSWGFPVSESGDSGGAGEIEAEREQNPHAQWVLELMKEADVRALPRPVEMLGRAMDSREFWEVFSLAPLKGRV